MNSHIDLIADLNDEDDEGLGWSMLSDASDPARIRPGAMLVAGNRQAQAVGWVLAVDDEGKCTSPSYPGRWRRTVTLSAAPWPDRPAVLLTWIQPVRPRGLVQSGKWQASRSCRARPNLGRPHPSRPPAGDRGAYLVQTTAGSRP
jgi:hypothetical protein